MFLQRTAGSGPSVNDCPKLRARMASVSRISSSERSQRVLWLPVKVTVKVFDLDGGGYFLISSRIGSKEFCSGKNCACEAGQFQATRLPGCLECVERSGVAPGQGPVPFLLSEVPCQIFPIVRQQLRYGAERCCAHVKGNSCSCLLCCSVCASTASVHSSAGKDI